jgi:hypothetical protein
MHEILTKIKENGILIEGTKRLNRNCCRLLWI